MTKIARCAEHGLHGQRDDCFVCRGPVEQVEMHEEPLVDILRSAATNAINVFIGRIQGTSTRGDQQRAIEQLRLGLAAVEPEDA